MIELGQTNRLQALRMTSVGMFLGHSSGEDVLLPNKYVPETLAVDDFINVFVYTDSEDRIIATTLLPHIERDEFGVLKVVSVTGIGAFMDWGLEKDLLVPHREQAEPMEVGRSYPVFLYYDQTTDRLVGSSRINRFLEEGAMPDLDIADSAMRTTRPMPDRLDAARRRTARDRYRQRPCRGCRCAARRLRDGRQRHAGRGLQVSSAAAWWHTAPLVTTSSLTTLCPRLDVGT